MANPIQVTYTPQTTGNHRICYKQTSPIADAGFCCMLDVTPSVIGVPKVFIIPDVGVTPCNSGTAASPVGVDPGNYTYTGYVQPTCDNEGLLKTNWPADVTFVVVAP